jgi:ATP-binding cassette, subfamily G (WHITE), member 2, PDR
VSGGERKRVSIAEAILSNASLQCWDNSTRGLDSANAIEFCKSLRLCSDVFGNAAAVAIYQAPQAAYDCFDKVVVLYQGRQIFFGPIDEAKEYFEELGFTFPTGSTVPDFLTSMTNPSERIIRPGYENSAPRTSNDFAQAWMRSEQRQRLQKEISGYITAYPFHGQQVQAFSTARQQEKARFLRRKSPFTLNYFQQVQLCIWRGFKLLKGDPTITIVQLVANFIQFLLMSSVFYDLKQTSDSLFHRGMVVFNALILNAFASILEILTLYSKRKIVEKHATYALYHPSAEALASILVDLPYKVVNAIIVNTIVYFMCNLNRAPGPYFFFLLVNFFTTLTMVWPPLQNWAPKLMNNSRCSSVFSVPQRKQPLKL